MDALFLLLNVVSLLCSLVLAFVIYHVLRMVIEYFRSTASDTYAKRFILLRMSDRTIGILCAICFLGLVL